MKDGPDDTSLVIGGAHSSPYSLKMRAVLRYRHIPHRWVLRNSRWDDLPAPPVPVIPVLAWPDGAGGYRDVMVDSSPQITRLEDEHHHRSVVPPDPVGLGNPRLGADQPRCRHPGTSCSASSTDS